MSVSEVKRRRGGRQSQERQLQERERRLAERARALHLRLVKTLGDEASAELWDYLGVEQGGISLDPRDADRMGPTESWAWVLSHAERWLDQLEQQRRDNPELQAAKDRHARNQRERARRAALAEAVRQRKAEQDDHYFGHRADDPPVQDLPAGPDVPWQPAVGEEVEIGKWYAIADDFHFRCDFPGGYSYFFCREKDGRFTWSCLDDDVDLYGDKFTTPERALAQLRGYHAEEIEKAERRKAE